VIDPMPIPMGVIVETGETHPPVTEAVLDIISPEAKAILTHARERKKLAIVATVTDPMDLSKSGWGVLFASDADPEVARQLQPLLEWRRGQVNNDQLFKVFEKSAGVRAGQSAQGWVAAKGVTLNAPVDPENGVPYYLLIVGSPARIPFEFQHLLDSQWSVGRLHFDNIDDYRAYATHVVEYERGAAAARQRLLALWMTKNKGDAATARVAGTLGPDFLGEAPKMHPIGRAQRFRIASYIGDDATKAKIGEVFRGAIPGGPPALIFTASHGAEFAAADAEVQRRRQGALITQEWMRGQPVRPEQYFSADDLTPGAAVHGAIVFIFACFGAGCPAVDSYLRAPDGSALRLAPEPFIARLPQALLSRGALAVVAHVDRAFSYSFHDVLGTAHTQLLRDPLDRIMLGQRVGAAVEALNSSWGTLAAELGLLLATAPRSAAATSAAVNLAIAREDSRNYVVLGDPAVRLDVARLR
jgi:hypothetical protein